MAFTGIDSIVSSKVGGKAACAPFSRTVNTGATSVAGRWHECLAGGGMGGAMNLAAGSAGTGIVCNKATVGAIPFSADVATDLRYITEFMATTGGATLAPGLLLLTDIIHIYPLCVMTGTPSTMSNHPTWTGTGDTRMTNANGVMCTLALTTAGTAANGALTPTYYDQSGNSTAAPRAMMAPATNAPIGSCYGDTGTVVTVGGPFMPLAAGDLGVQRIASYTIGTGLTSGVGCFILHRPIACVPIAATNLAGAREWTLGNRIYDDACLGMFIMIGGAATAGQVVIGEIGHVWG
jgi:hypothetical protein